MVSHVILRKQAAARDWKLAAPANNGRKVLVNRMWAATEQPIADSEWRPAPEGGRTPVFETGPGGIEIATCTEAALQDRHKHLAATEIFTVLAGCLRMYIDDAGPIELGEGDEVVILPGTVHEMVRGEPVLVRVHALPSGGAEDKYVQLREEGEWRRWSELAPDERRRAVRRQDQPIG